MSSRLSYILAPVAVTGMFISIVGCSNGEASTSAEMPATTPVQQDRLDSSPQDPLQPWLFRQDLLLRQGPYYSRRVLVLVFGLLEKDQ